MVNHSNNENLTESILSSITEIAATKNIDELLIEFSLMAHKMVSADRCTVWVLDKEKNIFWSKVADGLDRIEIPSDAGLVGEVVKTGKPIIINDVYKDSHFNPEVDKKTGYHTKNMITIPLTNSDGNILGAFQSINKTDGDFTEDDLKRLLFVTIYIGREIDAALLREELETTQREIIYTLAEAGEMRSKETGYHVKRVAEYSALLAKLIDLPQKQIDLIRVAAPLHDLGKIAIPDSILLKPARLTAEERQVMETHALLGYQMLDHSHRKIFQMAAIIAYEHHEKWNGTGYPRGLSGEDIHIAGRIVAIADVYDALANERCYKPAWEHSRIISLFQEERGAHFDPTLVDLFLANQDSFLEINEKYKDSEHGVNLR